MATEQNTQARQRMTNGHEPLEKDFSNVDNGHQNGGLAPSAQVASTYHLDNLNMDHEDALRRIRTAGSISISPELFEKIYLSPQNVVKGK
jgi:hypothetical protein